MGNIRDKKEDGGIVLSKEEKRKIEKFLEDNNKQSEADEIVKAKKNSVVVKRQLLNKGSNPRQKVVDKIIEDEKGESR